MDRARAAGVTDVVVPLWSRVVEAAPRALRRQPGVAPALGIHPQALPGIDPADNDRHLADCSPCSPAAAPWRLVSAASTARPPVPERRSIGSGRCCAATWPSPAGSVFRSAPLPPRSRRDAGGARTGRRPSGGVLHSFSGSAEQVPPFAALGLHFSSPGPSPTRRRASPWPPREPSRPTACSWRPTPRPDPTPASGSRNEPSYLPLVLQALASAVDPRPPTSTCSRPRTPGASSDSPRPDP